MATTKISLTLESTAAFLAEQAAHRDGLSISAWVSKFIHQNIHQHYPPKPYDGQALAVTDLEHQHTVTDLVSGRAAVQRGECWRYQLRSIPVTIGGASGWLNIARDITRVYQGALVEFLGVLDPADLDRVDKAICNTFGLPI